MIHQDRIECVLFSAILFSTLLQLMNFIPIDGDNPLNQPDGQARVFNALFEQLCILRADTIALQGTMLLLGTKQGLTGEQLVRERIELRNASYEKICRDLIAQLRGSA